MITPPRLETRPPQPYAAVRLQVPIPFGMLLPPLWQEVQAWLAERHLAPSGPPFIRYLTTDMSRKLDIEVGFPLAVAVAGEGRISGGVFPGGRYALAIYHGPYEGLVGATAELLDWAHKNAIPWRTSIKDGVEWWEARLENYLTDPATLPDPMKWQTELAFLVAAA